MLLGKLQSREGFPTLATPLQNERIMVFVFKPAQQRLFNCSLKHLMDRLRLLFHSRFITKITFFQGLFRIFSRFPGEFFQFFNVFQATFWKNLTFFLKFDRTDSLTVR